MLLRGLHGRTLGTVKFLLLAALALPLVILSLAPQSAAGARSQDGRPNIIFIVVDALRSDHVSAYGYSRQTTPVVDSLLADQGVLFSEATAVSSWTNPSNGAMLTSRMPSDIDTVWADMSRRIPEDETLLAEYLQEAGYLTAGFNSNFWMGARFGYKQGFDTYISTQGDDRHLAASLNKLAFSWLDDNASTLEDGKSPLFLFLYYYDPHSWYDPLPPFDTMYDPDYTGSLTPELYGHGETVVSGDLVLSDRDLEHLIALYDGDIAYWDQQLGIMMADLQQRGLLDNSLIILTSDHGQMFGEHDKWLHRNSLYEEVLRVPLLFRSSGTLPEGRIIDTPVDLLDVTPTVLDFIGIDRPEHMQGDSLVPLMNGQQTAGQRPIYAEMAGEADPNSDAYWIAPRSNLYAIKEDGLKLIHAQQAPENDQLYEIQHGSIYEQQNLIGADPDKAEALWSNLQERFAIPTEFLFLPVLERP